MPKSCDMGQTALLAPRPRILSPEKADGFGWVRTRELEIDSYDDGEAVAGYVRQKEDTRRTEGGHTEDTLRDVGQTDSLM
jgi:hypothetical protein